MDIRFTENIQATDTHKFLSSAITSSDLSHNQFLVLSVQKDHLLIDAVDNLNKLFLYPDDSRVLARWAGKWQSDYFLFTVKDVKTFTRLMRKKLTNNLKNEKI
jgi:hypothetical protein